MSETLLPVTTYLTVSLSIWLLILSWIVVKARRVASTSLGDGGDKILIRRIRAQGNLTEYAPLFIALIGLTEVQGGSTLLLSLIASAFLSGRLAHGYALGFTDRNAMGRVSGTFLTLVSMALAAIYCTVVILT